MPNGAATPTVSPAAQPAATVAESTPVFVDSSGRRQRRILRFAYLFGLAALAFVAATMISAFGGRVTPAGTPSAPLPAGGVAPPATVSVPALPGATGR
ncbi:hypothetical protein [Pilimelia terevasa]|uniref:hypothetical protein n=1 Tax=Pilimelia terevasa TaxID=53372 RepID=UPI0016693CA9|nr:hypothetical protein [Pilimelia terevasa]